MLNNFMPQVRVAVIVGGLILLIVAVGVGWLLGASNQKVKCEEARAQEYASVLEDQHKQMEQYNVELEARVAVADRASREAAGLFSKLNTLATGVADEIERRNPSVDCGPTDREHSLYLEAARSTRNP